MMVPITPEFLDKLAKQPSVRMLIFSDSHGQTEFMFKMARQLTGIDLILHLGDHCADLTEFADLLALPLLGVSGNCDGYFARLLPDHLLLTLAGHRLFMVHGHQYGVKKQLMKLLQTGSEYPYSADIILFGHTHKYSEHYFQLDEHQVFMLNPGSSYTGQRGQPASSALLQLDQSRISCEMLLDLT